MVFADATGNVIGVADTTAGTCTCVSGVAAEKKSSRIELSKEDISLVSVEGQSNHITVTYDDLSKSGFELGLAI
jgi:hypothetical protein